MTELNPQSLFALIADDQLEEVVTLIQQEESGISGPVWKEVVLLSGRLSLLAQQLSRNTIEPGEANRERSRIREALMLQVSQMVSDADQQQRVKKNVRLGIAIGAYLIMGLGILALVLSPKTSIRMEAELLVSQLTFTYQQGNLDLAGRKLAGLRMAHLERVEIQGVQYTLGESEDSMLASIQPLPDGGVGLTPFPEATGVALPILSPVRLTQLPLYSDATLTLFPSEEASLIKLIVEQDSGALIQVDYYQQLDLEPELMSVEGIPDYPELFDPTHLRVYGPKDSERSLSAGMNSGIFSLELSLQDSLPIEGRALQIEQPRFYQKDINLNNEVPISTVLGGSIRLIENRKNALRELEIGERQELTFTGEELLEVERLTILPEGIDLKLSGTVDTIETGMRREIQNPSWWEWLWHNYRDPDDGHRDIFGRFDFLFARPNQRFAVGNYSYSFRVEVIPDSQRSKSRLE